MLNSNQRRAFAFGAVGVIGSLAAFAAGARVGNMIDHGARAVTIARMPVPTISAQIAAPEAVSLR